MKEKEILLKLVSAESVDEVQSLMEKEPFFEGMAWWPYGDNELNFATIGNQQSDPVNALVEKIVNSIDALLMRECYEEGIGLTSSKAPQNMRGAVEKYFGVKEGDLSKSSLTDRKRRKLAENILVVASGDRKKPSISVIDSGEGQNPEDFKETFLSLPQTGSIKTKIPFVQGKFNMGSTGALMFCGETRKRYQLILSKRAPSIKGSSPHWGFTLIRESYSEGDKVSRFEYLVTRNLEVPSFPANKLELLPDKRELEWGTLIKLYSYQLEKPSNINLDLWRDFNRKLFSPALPVMLYETRFKPERIHGASRILVGNMARTVQEDSVWVQETQQITSNLGKFGNQKVFITLFKDKIIDKRNNAKRFRKEGEFTTSGETIFLTVNGQTHYAISRSLLKNKANLRDLADYLMIHIDLTDQGPLCNEIFHASRDRVRKDETYREFEERLLSDLKDNPWLVSWNEEYRRRAIADVQPDEHFVVDTARRVLRENPEWLRKLGEGLGVKVSVIDEGEVEPFKGSHIPQFLKLKGDNPKLIPVNDIYAWIKFETDAENNYLIREKDRGELIIRAERPVQSSFWLRDGLIQLKLITPKETPEGDTFNVKAVLTRPNLSSLDAEVVVKYTKPRVKGKGGKAVRRKPRKKEASLPKPDYVKKERWEEFGWGETDISKVDGSVIRINVDSADLHSFLSRYSKKFSRDSVIKAYKTAIYLYTFLVDNQLGENENRDEVVPEVMKGISKIVLPLNFADILESVEDG